MNASNDATENVSALAEIARSIPGNVGLRLLTLHAENCFLDKPLPDLYIRILAKNPDGLGPVWVEHGGQLVRNPKTITRL